MTDKSIIIPGADADLRKVVLSGQSSARPADPWAEIIVQAARAATPDLSADFLNAVTSLPMKAAELWATVMENSARTATVDFSWKDPLDTTGKKVLTDRHDIAVGVLDSGQALADRIAAVGKKVAGTKILVPENGREALQIFSRLIAETGEFLKKNPGKDEGASWKFELTTPFDQRVARIAEVELPEARGFLTTLFNDMTKIIETVDINLTKPKYGDNHKQFVQAGLSKVYESERGQIAVAGIMPGACARSLIIS